MLLGTTYRPKQITWLKLNELDSFNEIINLNLDYLRIGIYWDEVQANKNSYDYTNIQTLLGICESKQQKTVITIGMKAPGWPEFYFPKWINSDNWEEITKYLYEFIERSALQISKYKYISAIQIENEPLDKSGPQKIAIPEFIIEKEIQIIRKHLTKQKILLNIWGNDLSRNNKTVYACTAADIIGLDIYYKQFITKKLLPLYLGPRGSLQKTCYTIASMNKPFWLTELQAEPWEQFSKDYLSQNPKSFNSAILRDNYLKAKKLSPQAILFWGCEYWLWKKANGDPQIWNEVKNIINEERNNV